MATKPLILSEVPAIYGDDTTDDTWRDTVRWRQCDICDESPISLSMKGVPQDAWRRFYELLGECGLVVCEECVAGLDPLEDVDPRGPDLGGEAGGA